MTNGGKGEGVRTALVTGSAARIGRAIALRLAQEGYAVLAHYHTSREAAESLAREIAERGDRAELLAADLSAPDGPARLAEGARRAGPIDVLVNNASSWERTPLDTQEADAFDRMVAINLRAPYLLALEIGREMHARGSGCIVNLLDWSVERPYPEYLPYGIAKAGLAAATRGLARGLAPRVRVNGIAPGTVLLPEGSSPEQAERIRRAIPLGRIGDPEDVVEALVYLVRAPFVTGTILTLDGGRSLR
ncbi:MAG: SDR family oxidoreductase [Candidatus Eisenbacteria bacterium]|nr:SDR family oxidoreductase [Candidatus Latescibacterota bacterium]MBD3302681.1 SDR family oxidoreductase [Candidatus Eisenbacteria bacterium]